MDARKWKKIPLIAIKCKNTARRQVYRLTTIFPLFFSSHSDLQSSISVDSLGDVRAVSGGLSSSPKSERRCLLDLNAVTCAEDDFRGGIWD
ncbi:hypothetical protein NPIL_238111 [Nephila pilipes]|uniref:Uncharacterized protein n=1 Tax=Nephila pilipes TaxID=299642 RepID=A0A8X6PZA1_NEPPI|nr:hypothetical protein NPIL_238111 [Nephila pilipes]